ncbi:helix-turn-helix transcriptional regulator [Marinomonas ostreistagni]|uniref:Response regulator transcription factor n=1 Tax=Marinomonas ostreistagni TaxID=359209 RepID=A0ABS0ZCS9_9GAMM|nr:LuxR C-terminal-related transcriptional regulator [Marinomonas ostreistagni]MBJ7551472.1 response regulator transcription factor [Marinomonas ostreistagni]
MINKAYLFFREKLSIYMCLLGVSILFFGFDIVFDFWTHAFDNLPYKGSQIAHLTFEILAFIALISALRSAYQHKRSLEVRATKAETTVSVYQRGADALLYEKFSAVKLTNAEQEVTLFILKGLSPAEIGEIRGTTVGTVKAQTTSIFRKLDVKSRVELMSVLLHEVLDIDQLAHSKDTKSS